MAAALDLRRQQARLSAMLLAVCCLAIAVIVVLSNATSAIANKLASQLALQRETNGFFLNDGGYLDDGDYVLLDKLPHADYSRGGAYFIGASEMNTAIMSSALPPAERRLIHNYSLGDLRYTEVRHFVRMLVEDFGLLQAGGGKTTVVLGLSYQMARIKRGHAGYVKALFKRHGFYDYDWDGGIHPIKLSAPVRAIEVERNRAARYLRSVTSLPNRVTMTPMSNDKKKALLERLMIGDWLPEMRREVHELQLLIEYLQGRGVHVRGILHPLGSWQDELPYDTAFRKEVMPMLQAHGVQVTDLSRSLKDDEFIDHVHARYSGQLKLHDAYRQVALEALSQMGMHLDPQ
jgi:hypothetical protein